MNLSQSKGGLGLGSMIEVSRYFSNRAEELAIELVEGVLSSIIIEIPFWEKEQAINMYRELFVFLANSLTEEEKDPVPELLIDWSKKNAAMQVSSGGKISEIVVRYPPTRNVFIDLFTRISTEFGLSIKQHSYLIKRMNDMLDTSLNETVFSFERISDQYREETQAELAELSAPLVPVKNGIVILPLIGEIDSFRANYIMEKVVPKIASLDVEYVIADFSGVLTINNEIAHYLHQIGSVIRLMGIHVITTGLRPELAQLVVNTRLDITAVKTYANVKQALESINKDFESIKE